MEVFIWNPLLGAQGETRFDQYKAQFGDGYATRCGNGINNRQDNWPLSFSGDSSEVFPIRDFLESHAAGQSFNWTAPGREEAGLYAVDGYSLKSLGGDLYILTTTFKQTFLP